MHHHHRLTARGPVGIEDGTIPDSAFTASTYWDHNYSPQNCRINGPRSWVSGNGHIENQWIQVDLGKVETITAVLIQGRPDYRQWTKRFSLSYSLDNRNFTAYLGGRVLGANKDQNTVKRQDLDEPIVARFVRLHVVKYVHYPGLRFELIRAFSPSSGVNPSSPVGLLRQQNDEIVEMRGLMEQMVGKLREMERRNQQLMDQIQSQ